MLKEWIENNSLDCKIIASKVIETPIGVMVEIIPEPEEKLFNNNFELMVSSEDFNLKEQTDAKYYLFNFGGNYYYSDSNKPIQPELNIFKYIGESKKRKYKWPFLGIHGRYELMNGTREYKDWCIKANFLKIKTLGICEHSTLAGTLPFQNACNDAGIKPIIGGTYTVERNNTQTYDVKLYAMNKTGWRNLLRVNKVVNVDNSEEKTIKEWDLIKYFSEGLVCVIDPSGKYSIGNVIDMMWRGSFFNLFMQFDVTESISNDRDIEKLNRLKYYLDNFTELIQPIIISDAYYLDKEEFEIKELLNSAGSVKGQIASEDKYFKHLDDIMGSMDSLFKQTDERFEEVLRQGVLNCNWIAEKSNFIIETGNRYLPVYEMSIEEKDIHETNVKMFLNLIEEGVEKTKILEKYSEDEVYDRIEEEAKVIINANVHDYFLITWDEVEWCKKNNILTGLGRGSAAGCLISYLLGIVRINPLDYGLIFERFLNPGRAAKSLPDIDLDHEGLRRDEVKRYMENKYGQDFVASIGTFTTLQMRAAMKELNRLIGKTDTGTMNYVSQIFDGKKWEQLFSEAVKKPQLKKWIFNNPELVNLIPLCFNSPKSQSVHPCATIVIPKSQDEKGNEITIFDRIPMRMDDNGMLVTEWEGGMIEDAGYLKQDILGIKQLDKFRKIINLIKESVNIDIDIYNIPLEDVEVLSYFGKGLTKDVFHFGSEGLSNYMRMMNPNSIDDLINANALFRPGTMASNAHIDYIKLKEGEKSPIYDFGLKEVTENTFGLYIFQEQVMMACRVLGGFSLGEADDIRKAMGKQKLNLIQTYRSRFIDNAIKLNCPEKEAVDIWQKLEVFAGYGFNKSHAAAYAITGYICNWLKHYYPVQFWVTALQFTKDDQIPSFVGEINKTKSIEIMPPDINNSNVNFIADYKERRIFWSITKIKHVGESSVEILLEERIENGPFKSLEDFLERVEKRRFNKRSVTHMILAGCFDLMYNISNVKERKSIIQDFYIARDIKPKDFAEWYTSDSTDHEWFWILKQHEVSGLGDMSYRKALSFSKELSSHISMFADPERFYSEEVCGEHVVIGGIITSVEEKKTKKGMMGSITLDCNTELIKIRVWSEQWEGDKEGYGSMRNDLLKAKGRILFISGKVAEPSQWNPDNILQTVGGKRRTLWDIL